MFKRLLVIFGLICAALATWPAWADGSPALPVGAGVPSAIAAAPDGVTLAVGTNLGVWFLSAANLAPLGFWDTRRPVTSVAYSADGRYLRAGDQFFDTPSGTASLLVPANLGWQPSAPSPEHDCSAAARRCLVYQFDQLLVLDQLTLTNTARLRTGRLLGAAWSPDGRTIYAVVSGGVQAWDAASGQLQHSQQALFAQPSQQHIARQGREAPSAPRKEVKKG